MPSTGRGGPLSDAALTPYHAIKRNMPRLTPGSAVLVIGVGGLGHLAVQILRAVSPAEIVAVDVDDDEKLDLARALGADHAVRSGEEAAHQIRGLTRGLGAAVVLDLVGADATMQLAHWGSGVELMEVLELARRGAIKAHVRRFSLDEAEDAYRQLREGKIDGRAVIVPHAA